MWFVAKHTLGLNVCICEVDSNPAAVGTSSFAYSLEKCFSLPVDVEASRVNPRLIMVRLILSSPSTSSLKNSIKLANRSFGSPPCDMLSSHCVTKVVFQALLCILKERLYYIWGHMKNLVYETKVDSRAALRLRIFAVILRLSF